jgi:hypothetical protein
MTTVAEAWGLRCPECGSDDGLEIQAKAWVVLTPDGTRPSDADGNTEWDDDSPCTCGGGRQYEGRVRDFKAVSK